MNLRILTYCLPFFFVTTSVAMTNSGLSDGEDAIQRVLIELIEETIEAEQHFLSIKADLSKQIEACEDRMVTTSDFAEFKSLYLEKERLRKQIELNDQNGALELSKIRYKKGLELIKLLYEKVLALDYHFTSLRTVQNISKLSNPNDFADFKSSMDKIMSKVDKKSSFSMPSLLQNNVYVNLVSSLMGSFLGNGSKQVKEKNLEDISCMLDFTSQMHADLQTIHYETEYLKNSNTALRDACVELFVDYTKPIEYKVSLIDCRKNDDWEQIDEMINAYVDDLHKMNEGDETDQIKGSKGQIDMEFSIDRLLEFVRSYNALVNQGVQYYKKFDTILSSYPNESQCASELPIQFDEIKRDVDMALAKFTEAYDIAEIRGSKLKNLLYGIIE